MLVLMLSALSAIGAIGTIVAIVEDPGQADWIPSLPF